MVWILQDLIGERMKEGLKDLMLDLEAGQSRADFQQNESLINDFESWEENIPVFLTRH